ncbi:CotO family spore coat protein [Thalassorhabdus alkalitolerans]|uniref:CotO family spore coat protein n=1 Tax=Thalassorhabdus alkalitolerans TaxID=2282697 RepID=UPI0036DF119D
MSTYNQKKPVQQPLYYIDQPQFKSSDAPQQMFAVKRKLSDKKAREERKPKQRKEKGAKNEQKNMNEKEKDILRLEQGQGIEETIKKENRENEELILNKQPDFNVPKEVKETIAYLKTVPHFIHPVITCETDEQYYEGYFKSYQNQTITLETRDTFTTVSVHEKDIKHLAITSL